MPYKALAYINPSLTLPLYPLMPLYYIN
ncbi:uncharacterized protein FFFS_16012 [Fusarium fujikuroi]|nr:uncharacterized protein FFFS_16012 [Fusarium fujikuroi]